MRPARAALRAAILSALALGFSGCRPGPQGSATASVVVDNAFEGACPGRHPKPAAITASVDQAPPVAVPDNAKFQFANLKAGAHTLFLRGSGPAFAGGGASLSRGFELGPGATARFEITCAADGSVAVSGPNP